MKRLAIAVLSGCAIIGAFWLAPGETGVTVASTNGVTVVKASTSIVSLIAAVVIGLCYFITLDGSDVASRGRAASTSRRAVAWLVDFVLALLCISSFLALIPLAREAVLTGHFEWQFERSTASGMDWVIGIGVVCLTFAGLAAYWALPVRWSGQTVGQAIFGLRAVPLTDQAPPMWKALVRGLAALFAPVLWLARAFSARDTFWHDDFAGVRVIKIDAPGTAT